MKTPSPDKTATAARDAKNSDSSDAFFAQLDHPLKEEIGSVRAAILATDRAIVDGVKWSSISFRTTEYFATVHLRSRDSVHLICHLGAKVRATPEHEIVLPSFGRWLARDRCLLELGRGRDVGAKLPELKRFVRQWIALLASVEARG